MDKVYLNRPSVCEVLRAKIQKYKREHPRLNSSQIARRFGVSSSTFNRIENNDIKNPSIDQAIKILRGIGDCEGVADFVRTYYPDIHEGLFEYFVESAQATVLDESVEKYFCDESTYKMMMLATSKCGLDENYVLQEFGRTGHQKFMKLAAKGILVNRDGKFFTSAKDVYLNIGTTAELNKFLYKSVREEFNSYGELSSSRQMLVYESVDRSVVRKELNDLCDEFNAKVTRVLRNPKNAGNDCVAFSTLFSQIN